MRHEFDLLVGLTGVGGERQTKFSEAFDRLRRASQVSGRPLKVIAEAVVDTLGGE